MNAKELVHKGALIKDNSGLLEGDGKEARIARFTDAADIRKKKKALETVIKGWMRLRDEAK
jgi:hypothetical protein